MTIKVITKNKILFQDTIKRAQFPGVDGMFGVMKNHTPMVYVLKKGKVKVTKEDDKELFIEINGGIFEVFNNELVVLAD